MSKYVKKLNMTLRCYRVAVNLNTGQTLTELKNFRRIEGHHRNAVFVWGIALR